MTWFGVLSYAAAACTYGAMTAVLLASHPGGRAAIGITSAAAITTFWAVAIAVLVARSGPLAAIVALDAVQSLGWTAAMLGWLASPSTKRRPSTHVMLLSVAALFAVWSVLAAVPAPSGLLEGSGARDVAFGQSVHLALLGMALVGLLTVEQVYRNAREPQRERLRLLCLGIGAIFVVNVFVYSQASLLGGLVPVLWQGRGLANAALAPLIVVALKRQSEWEQELFVSRQVVFYTTSLVAVGGYLLVMSAVGYVIGAAGGQWGLLLESIFLVAALAVLVYVLFSASIRARLKIFLVKHFYRNKYDYRVEWLRLTAALSRTGDLRLTAASALEGIAGIIGSREGSLWIGGEDGRFEQIARLDGGEAAGAYESSQPIVTFLKAKGWVVDSTEYAAEPDLYGSAFGDPAEGILPKNSIIVPLDRQGHLQGFVILERPPAVKALNFEDHDILKTAGRQVAVVLAQAIAQEQVTATRQFEAVNKLATFVMHDLKNVVAQQELVVANAQRFRHRPEFVDDAFETIRASVERMRKVLDQLRTAAPVETGHCRVDVSKVLMEVRSHCSDRQPVPEVDRPLGPLFVDMDRDKLVGVLTHVVRNAQDATPSHGRITMELARAGQQLVITVTDTGRGMDRVFLRERLFKAFDTTKGAQGMGIGAYQVRETVRAAGGEVDVESEPGSGTRFRVKLPVLDAAASALVNLPAA